MGSEKRMARIFKALSHPYRLELFLNILEQEKINVQNGERERPCLLADFFAHLKIGAPTLSHHIKELVNAGLIETEKEGKFLVCRVNTQTLKEIKRKLAVIDRVV